MLEEEKLSPNVRWWAINVETASVTADSLLHILHFSLCFCYSTPSSPTTFLKILVDFLSKTCLFGISKYFMASPLFMFISF